jgi:hypothetical protein
MKQSELAKKYGITPQRIGQIRKKYCAKEDFCEKTRELTETGIRKIQEQLDKEDDAIIEPKFVKVQALRQTPNRLFWFCKLFEKPVRKVTVAIPSTHADNIRPLMIFQAQEIEKSNEKFYRHEIIYKRELQREQRIKEIYK